jgi:hypothetical protein
MERRTLIQSMGFFTISIKFLNVIIMPDWELGHRRRWPCIPNSEQSLRWCLQTSSHLSFSNCRNSRFQETLRPKTRTFRFSALNVQYTGWKIGKTRVLTRIFSMKNYVFCSITWVLAVQIEHVKVHSKSIISSFWPMVLCAWTYSPIRPKSQISNIGVGYALSIGNFMVITGKLKNFDFETLQSIGLRPYFSLNPEILI